MNLTEKDKEDIYNIGYLGLGVSDIIQNFTFVPSVVVEQFETKKGEIYLHWYRGWFTAECELRKVMMDAAKNSSQPALLQMAKMRQSTKKDNVSQLNNYEQN